jgi:hypothetical protein
MKNYLIATILAVILAAGTRIMAQEQPKEYLGLPGDNFNLYAVMQLFQESETLEGFERSLNEENTRINNLDLNNDNLIDYIKVIDYVDSDVHNIVLQAVLDRNESQDIAVFTVQRLRDGSVQIQLTGDEALYGKNYIIEPIYAETPNPGYTGGANRHNANVVRTNYVEVAAWPVVRFIYLPDYSLWHSSWYWGYYPSFWHPWHPYYWHYYYGYHYNWYPEYYAHFHRWDHHRYDHWNDFYYHDKRVYSRNVTININDGRYKNTYSHPEQKKEGEALYTRVHADRVSNTSTGTNTGRRAASQLNPDRQSSGTTNGTTRRSSGSVQRTTTTVNDKANTNSTAGQAPATNRRSSESVSSKPASKNESGQKTESARRSRQPAASVGSSDRRSSKSESTVKKSSTSKDSERSNTSKKK